MNIRKIHKIEDLEGLSDDLVNELLMNDAYNSIDYDLHGLFDDNDVSSTFATNNILSNNNHTHTNSNSTHANNNHTQTNSTHANSNHTRTNSNSSHANSHKLVNQHFSSVQQPVAKPQPQPQPQQKQTEMPKQSPSVAKKIPTTPPTNQHSELAKAKASALLMNGLTTNGNYIENIILFGQRLPEQTTMKNAASNDSYANNLQLFNKMIAILTPPEPGKPKRQSKSSRR